MKRIERVIYFVMLCAVLLTVQTPALQAQFVEDGAALCSSSGAQEKPVIASDGSGGAIIAWQDYRSGTDYDIYVQRVDASGDTLWGEGGVAACTADYDQQYPTITSDGDGGAIITWQDYRSGTEYDIYAQHVNASGETQWPSGFQMCYSGGDQRRPVIVSDDDGGAIIAWRDYRSGLHGIFMQHVDNIGAILWGTSGKEIYEGSVPLGNPQIAQDGLGGAVVAWEDFRDTWYYKVYAQRVDATGAIMWTSGGEPLCPSGADDQRAPSVASDGGGGAIIAWQDYRSGSDYDVYAQHVTDSGTLDWGSSAQEVIAASQSQYDPKIVSDGVGGAIIVWEDMRNIDDIDIYGERLDQTGSSEWSKAICTAAGDQTDLMITSDGNEGVIVAWEDERGDAQDIYAQRVDDTGEVTWAANGVVVCNASDTQELPALTTNGTEGAIIAWADDRGGNTATYAQALTRHGYWGYPAPRIIAVQDVPGDQGGYIWIDFEASRVDAWPDQGITHYSIWRGITSPAAFLTSTETIALDAPSQATPEMIGSAFYATSEGYWQLIGTMEALLQPGYGYPVETLRDETGGDQGWEYFRVSAHGIGDYDFWDSPPDSGYSIDNIPPATLSSLAGEYIGDSEVHLHWGPNTDPDLSHYAIYRGTDLSFVAGDAQRSRNPDHRALTDPVLIGTTTDTSYVDVGYGYGAYYYQVAAVDIHENESTFATLTPEMIAGVTGEQPHYGNILFQNAPNPFLSSTRIAFSTEEAGHVSLRVFDAKGRLVRVLVDELLQADHYVEQWDGRDRGGKQVPAGTYFYSLEAPGWKSSKKMTVAR
jgi:hypothetical protein